MIELEEKTMNENVLVLTLDSNAFEKMKGDFNKILKRTLGNMQTKGSDEATLTLKLNISLTEQDVPDYDSPNPAAMKTIQNPRFDHKISSVMQIKNQESGTLNGDYELVWDDSIQDYVMKPINDGQMSFTDNDCPVYTDGYVVEETKSLPPKSDDDMEEIA